MELDNVSEHAATFSLMYPSIFMSLKDSTVQERPGDELVNRVVSARASPEDIESIKVIELQLRDDLRACCSRTFSGFQDEIDDMFESSIVDSDDFKINMNVYQADSRVVSDAVEVVVRPVAAVVRRGSVVVLWALDMMDDPHSELASGALDRVRELREELDSIEARVKEDVSTAQSALERLNHLR
jgi:hypothetical protein